MANVVPPQGPLPPFLDPLFSYLSSCLPLPVTNALLTVLAHGLAFFNALIGLGSALISSKPSDWDAQKIVPPLITLLAAYLALASALRTAMWFVRTATWLVKWGIVTAAVSAALAWLLGAANGGGGIMPGLIAMVSDKPGQDAGSRSSSQRARSRPQAWDSFDEHWEWQFEEQQWNAADVASPAAQVQQFVANALDAARGGSWLSIARGALQSFSAPEQTGESRGDSHDRQHAQQNDQVR
ncbi:hypothetical protein BC827DRAFT_1131672 [Russula dissimulans]|nr:hypothetical protein BC827DRAFT_1131672 [Russula dissimulans]